LRWPCPKLPYDRDARIGVTRLPSNPDKIEKVFGYSAVITTSMEPELGIELPVGCITFAGNANRSWGAWVHGSWGAWVHGSWGAWVRGSDMDSMPRRNASLSLALSNA
jgi:hypothetical protein